MNTVKEIHDYHRRFGKSKLVVDTNVLLLLFVGSFDKDFLPYCKATNMFSEKDFDTLLKKIFCHFESEIIITPQILAELSNISRQEIKDPKLHWYFKTLVDKLKLYKEGYIPLERLLGIELKVLVRLGFPDISLVEVCKELKAVLLTDENGLYQYATSCKIPAINFKSIRIANSMEAIPA